MQESTNEYSHLDPKAEEAEQDIDDELGDLDPNDLIQFAYQIATGMVKGILIIIMEPHMFKKRTTLSSLLLSQHGHSMVYLHF